jgi:cysteine-rich repeat protein
MKRKLVVVLILSFVLILSISFASAGFFSDLWKKITGRASSGVCGNQILETGELCDKAATDSINNPYGAQCSSNCWVNGAPPYWAGCRGSGAHICTDHPNVTNQYFIDHPTCIKNPTCAGLFFNCNGVVCPNPATTPTNTATVRCGDGLINQDYEQCDLTNLSGKTCVGLGYSGGKLLCNENCKGFNTLQCTETTPEPPPEEPPVEEPLPVETLCGDGVIGSNEECDSTNLTITLCNELNSGYTEGNLSCDSLCNYNKSQCAGFPLQSYCGDGVIDLNEQCDGNNLTFTLCAELNSSIYSGGAISCTSSCEYNFSQCIFLELPEEINQQENNTEETEIPEVVEENQGIIISVVETVVDFVKSVFGGNEQDFSAEPTSVVANNPISDLLGNPQNQEQVITNPLTSANSNLNQEINKETPVDALKEKVNFREGIFTTSSSKISNNFQENILVFNTLRSINSITKNSYIVEFKELSILETYGGRMQLSPVAPSAPSNLENGIESKKTQIRDLQERAKRDLSEIGGLTGNVVKDTINRITGHVVQENSPEIINEYENSFSGFSVIASPEQIDKIKKLDYVKAVYLNVLVSANLQESVPLINAPEVWKLDSEGNDCATSGKECLTGKGIKIAIIDTGVDYNHPDLGSCIGVSCKVLGGWDFVNQDDDPMDDMGHGTHVAATAAGKGIGESYNGVAPDANIIAYKVLNSNGQGYESDIIAAIEHAVDPNQDGDFSDKVDIISMSLGGLGNPDDPMSKSVDSAVNSGVIAVIAAGNSGPGQQTIGSPGTARNAITVGASSKSDNIAWFSSRGPVIWKDENGIEKSIVKPDVVAPGFDICAAQSSQDTIWQDYQNYGMDIHCLDDKHISISGTSMATPHVTGAAALLKQKNPDWNPEEIKAALKSTAINIGLNPLNQGSGRINILKSASQKNKDIAELQPLENLKRGILNITGFISTNNLKKYTLSYSKIDYVDENGNMPSAVLLESSAMPVNNQIQYELNLDNLDDGEYLLEFKLEDVDGEIAIDYGYFKVDNVQILSPLGSDIYRAGDTLKINLEATSLWLSRISLKYEKFDSSNPLIISRDVSSQTNWDTTDLETGWYKIEVTNQDKVIETVNIYLDLSLKKGWPKRIEFEKGGEDWFYWGGYLEPLVEDLNGDGQKEIIVFKGGDPPKIIVYDYNGFLLWEAPFGDGHVTGGNLHIPLIADLNNDGNKEILAYNHQFWSKDQPGWGTVALLSAFKNDGSLLWTSSLPQDLKPTILVADLNNDGNKEIIIQGNSGGSGDSYLHMILLDSQGEIIYRWKTHPISGIGGLAASPAVGDFDNDSDLEIVSALPYQIIINQTTGEWSYESIIYIYNEDGSLVSGWPKIFSGFIFSSPAIADLNNNGKEGLVFGISNGRDSGLHALDRNGNYLSGWPIHIGDIASSPSIADFDGDDNLEMGVSALGSIGGGFYTYILESDGSVASGWPQQTQWNDYYGSISGDIDGDGVPDLITTAGSGIPFFGKIGGVYAWKGNGELIKGFPKATEIDAQAPAAISDINNDGKLELVASSDWDTDVERCVFEQCDKFRGSVYVWELESQVNENSMQWPTVNHDNQRTGRYNSKDIKSPTINISFMPGEAVFISCQDNESGCNESSYRYYLNSYSGGRRVACPIDLSQYQQNDPRGRRYENGFAVLLNSSSWVCAYAEDNAGNQVFSEPTWVNINSGPLCGNAIAEGTEQCDDGNILSGDGCSSICQKEKTISSQIIESFIASPAEIAYGGSTTLSWSAIGGSICVGIWSNSASLPSIGSYTIKSIDKLPKTFTLQCTYNSVVDSKSVVVREKINELCTDSDGGINYTVKGTRISQEGTFTDYCKNSTAVSEPITNSPGPYLLELYCQSDTNPGSEIYLCPNGCVDGACVPPKEKTGVCTDSDNGQNYNVKGALTFNNQEIGSDFCNDDGQLNELYCLSNNTEYTSAVYDCPNGCNEGACIKKSLGKRIGDFFKNIF